MTIIFNKIYCILSYCSRCTHVLSMLSMYSMKIMFKHENNFPFIFYLYPYIDWIKEIYLKITTEWFVKLLGYEPL